MQTQKRKPGKTKPVVLTVAVLIVIVLSVVTPQILLLWQDESQFDRFTPIQQNLVSLGSNGTSSYRDLLLNTPNDSFIQLYETEDAVEIGKIISETLLPKIDELVAADLLPGELFAYSEKIAENEHLELFLYESVNGSYGRQMYTITDEAGTGLVVRFDKASGKITSFELYAPEAQLFSQEPADYITLFENYIHWLDMGTLDDWDVRPEQGADGVVRSVLGISTTYGLSAHISSYNSWDGFSYRFIMEKLQ
jgi:hypothetical protein